LPETILDELRTAGFKVLRWEKILREKENEKNDALLAEAQKSVVS